MTPVSAAQKQESGPGVASKVLRLPLVHVAREDSERVPGDGHWHTSRLTGEILRAADVAIAVTLLIAGFALTQTGQLVGGIDEFLLVRVTPKNLALLAFFALVWPVVFALFGLYEMQPRISRRQEAMRVLGACSMGGLATIPFLLTSSGAFQIQAIGMFWLCVLVATLFTRTLLRVRIPPLQQSAPRRVLIVGSGPRALNLYRQIIADPRNRQEVEGFVDSSAGMLAHIGHNRLGMLEELETILMRRAVDEVLIALPIKSCYAEIQDAIDVCERVGVEARYLADVFQHSLARPRYESSSAVPLVSLKVVPDDVRLAVKRGFDLLGAGAGLVLLAPLFLLIAAAIKLNAPGPVIFAQDRYGYNKRRFRMFKFRTMVPGAEAMQASLEHLNEVPGPVFKIRNDPRITPVGRFLRRTSLDELPQLFNVLLGDMSLVGPRPLPVRDVENFSEAWLMRRFSVAPGCTGLWQVSGRSNLGFDDWVTLDLHYIDRWSLRLDFKILLKTVPAVLRGSGAS